MRRSIDTADWWPAVAGLLLLGIPKALFASELSDAWKGYGGLLAIGLGACLLGIGAYRINKWARGR